MLRAKLCGMKTEVAARAADEAGADFIGFIFWPGSHRFVTPAEVFDPIGFAVGDRSHTL